MPGRRWDRWLWPVAGLLAGIALYLSGITVWTVWIARSEVPWRDQWTFLDDAREILAHRWTRLWYSYWGHRPVMTRLLQVLDIRWFSGLNTPVLMLNLALQGGEAGLLIWIAWRVFGRPMRPLFVIAAALILQLSFSSLQMEGLIWAAYVGYLLVWTSATAAFLLLATCSQQVPLKGVLLGACILSGITSTLSSANGAFVWPVLILQAWVLRLSVRVRATLLLAGVLVLGIYFRGYQPETGLGMGVASALLHPGRSIPILGMLAAAPLTSVSITWAMVAGCVALVAAIYVLVKAALCRAPALVTVYAGLALFALLTMGSIVTSRISPEFVAERVRLHLLVVPSRYYTAIFLFWAGSGGLSLWMAMRNRREWAQFAVVGSMLAIVTLGTSFWQIGEAANWRGYFGEIDVAGSALIMHVDDSGNPALAQIYPDAGLRDRISTWLQQGKLALFAERRARLVGQRVAAAGIENGGCQGEAENAAYVSDGVLRITGWAVDVHNGGPPRDLVFTDRSGMITGVARSGLRRPDLKQKIEAVGWQGYARTAGAGSLDVYGVLDGAGHYCHVGKTIPLPVK